MQAVQQLNQLVLNQLNDSLDTSNGNDFLELRNQMQLSYLINLVEVCRRKFSGDSIQNGGLVDRLVELRTVLEKIRPVSHKMRYQLDKAIKQAVTRTVEPHDPINLKPNLDALVADDGSNEDDNGEDDDEDDDETVNKPKAGEVKRNASGERIYVPPKLSAVHYDGDIEKEEKTVRKRRINHSIAEDLKEEYLDTPMEVSSTSRAEQIISREERERKDYEEAYLTRLPVPKKQKKLMTLGTLADEVLAERKKSLGPSKKTKLGKMKGKGKFKGKRR